MRPMVEIKGIREGILITIGDGPWDEVRGQLLEHLDSKADFLKGAKLILEVGNRAMRAVELSQVRNEISERGLVLWAVLSYSPMTEKTAQVLGLATRIAKPRQDAAVAPVRTQLESGEQAILVRRTFRSGFRLQNEGHVIIIGDVNPGAEVIAGGDVIVWGRLRGMVHAGAGGNEKAVVCALDLSPTQLRIAGQISITPKRRGKPQPEMARIVNGQVVAEPWDPKRR